MNIDKIRPKEEQSKMASKEEIVDMLNKQKMKKSFESRNFSGKTTGNSDGNYCKLNNIQTAKNYKITGVEKWFLTQPEDTV